MSVPVSDTEPTPDEIIAAEVWACLGRRRMSANKAATALGWKQTYLSRRLTGAVSFSVPELFALAELLDVPVREFFRQADSLAAGAGQHSSGAGFPLALVA